MRILVLSNLYPPHFIGGYELGCQIVVEELRQRGHEIEILTSDFERTGESSEQSFPIHRVLKLHGMFGRPWLGIGALRALEFHNNSELRLILQRFRPDIVYVWNMGGLSKSMLFTLEQARVPTDFSVADHWIARSAEADVWLNWWNGKARSLPQKILRMVWTLSGYRRIYSRRSPTSPIRNYRFRRLHFCSAFLREWTARAGVEVGHAEVIFFPVRLQVFTGEPNPPAKPLSRLLFAGRLHPDKGVMTALRALAMIRSDFCGRLTICGEGEPDYVLQLKQFVIDEKLPVDFEATADPERMREIYRSHDAALFTSEWPEPFGLVWAEALACGRPVICTNLGGAMEILRDRDNALIYPAGDAESLGRSILELAKNPELRHRLAVAGQTAVRDLLDHRAIVTACEQHLEKTLAAWPSLA